ncbi:hypothetical protein SO802_008372 [Lithocarpus litseifolius]|uniref:Uncharacterized protein n=1 Tax=Lithocarpus litseifolius TaxID=425828 RepID=A0AAW2D8G0_9ROSI
MVRSAMEAGERLGPEIRISERELLKGVAENPPLILSHAATELVHRVNTSTRSPPTSRWLSRWGGPVPKRTSSSRS